MGIFNNSDFFPTPKEVIFKMLESVNINDKIVLEPSAGKGDIIDYLTDNGAKDVLFCEIDKDLQKISSNKGRFLKSDFLEVESSEISHIDLIVMNPPFSADEKHILHAFDVAPPGCKIIALCNAQTILNPYSQSRKELKRNIEFFGTFENLGDCFKSAERSTGVEIGLIILQKSGGDYKTEFEGFFLDEEEEPQGVAGIMSYNVVRDLVNRYVESIKIYDQQLETAIKLNEMRLGYFDSDYTENDRKSTISISINRDGAPFIRSDFKKEMQKRGWKFIFKKMNLQKHTTTQLREDINKFVETQTEIPFTMKNIYRMLEIVVGTTEQRMDKAILEVFDKVTQHYHENRYNVEGWKTNSHYLLCQKFIIPSMVEKGWSGQVSPASWSSGNFEKIEDLLKAICYITGDNYDNFIDLRKFITYKYKVKIDDKYLGYESCFHKLEQHNGAFQYQEKLKNEGKNAIIERSEVSWGEWIKWGYFNIKCFKKGTIHFEFLDKEIWAKFNQRIAKIKGFPLYEKAPDKRTERQKNKDSKNQTSESKQKTKPTILKTFTLNKV